MLSSRKILTGARTLSVLGCTINVTARSHPASRDELRCGWPEVTLAREHLHHPPPMGAGAATHSGDPRIARTEDGQRGAPTTPLGGRVLRNDFLPTHLQNGFRAEPTAE